MLKIPMVTLLRVNRIHSPLLVLQGNRVVVLRVYGEVSVVVRFHSHGSIHQAKRRDRHLIVVNATSVVQRNFNALVRKRLLVTRIDNPHSANVFG